MPPEKPYHVNSGRLGGPAAVVASRERSGAPGTPSRKEKQRETSAVQDPGLKDFVCWSISCLVYQAPDGPGRFVQYSHSQGEQLLTKS